MYERLLEKAPDNIEFVLGRASAIEGVGKCYHKGKEYDEALAKYDDTLDVLKPLVENEAPDSRVVAALRSVRSLRLDVYETLERHEEALAELSQLLPLSDNSASLRIQRARFLALTNKHAKGAAEIKELLGQEEELSRGEYYNAGCVFAVAARSAKADDALADEDRTRLVSDYRKQAIDCLRQARQAGYFGTDDEIEYLTDDPDLEALREDTNFEKFMSQLRNP
jgi:predicted Zn-dependent protease